MEEEFNSTPWMWFSHLIFSAKISKQILGNIGDGRHPWRTPHDMLMALDINASWKMKAFWPKYILLIQFVNISPKCINWINCCLRKSHSNLLNAFSAFTKKRRVGILLLCDCSIIFVTFLTLSFRNQFLRKPVCSMWIYLLMNVFKIVVTYVKIKGFEKKLWAFAPVQKAQSSFFKTFRFFVQVKDPTFSSEPASRSDGCSSER